MTEEPAEATVVGQSRITARGQVTLPKEMRKKYGMKSGQILYFLEVDGSILLKIGPLVITA